MTLLQVVRNLLHVGCIEIGLELAEAIFKSHTSVTVACRATVASGITKVAGKYRESMNCR
jgi:hypothetical protein